MNFFRSIAFLVCATIAQADDAPIPVLKHSDVVFMYQASRQIYEDYGATVLAWGGTPRPASLEAAAGMRVFGSVGMVTEFSRYYERFPTNYEAGLCRDLNGQPYKVPWLTDHQHKSIPYWWCCTRQPVFRQYISERVVQTVKAGAHGVHIDDHLGTAGSIFLGGCFCHRCMFEFRENLKRDTPAEVKDPATYDYPQQLREWIAGGQGRKAQDHPLWERWRNYQLRGAAQFMSELRALAARTAGNPVPMSANACLLWGPHLSDYHTLDFFSAEIDHHASTMKFSAAPVVAYRIAEAVGRPLASTGSGGDWAFIKENNLPGLVTGWIALGYASGHSIMAPNRQWCYTKDKGTHWYEGPKEKFAPFYRFVRAHPELFDGFETFADVTVAYSQRTYDRAQRKLMDACQKFTAANTSYALALGGDDVVNHPLPAEQLRSARRWLAIEPQDFRIPDQQTIRQADQEKRLADLNEALAIQPAVRIEGNAPLRVFPRVKPGAAVVHILNWDYGRELDAVRPVEGAVLRIDLAALSVAGASQATLFSPGAEPVKLKMEGGAMNLPEIGLWSVLEIQPP